MDPRISPQDPRGEVFVLKLVDLRLDFMKELVDVCLDFVSKLVKLCSDDRVMEFHKV